jgi:hypothetical protein
MIQVTLTMKNVTSVVGSLVTVQVLFDLYNLLESTNLQFEVQEVVGEEEMTWVPFQPIQLQKKNRLSLTFALITHTLWITGPNFATFFVLLCLFFGNRMRFNGFVQPREEWIRFARALLYGLVLWLTWTPLINFLTFLLSNAYLLEEKILFFLVPVICKYICGLCGVFFWLVLQTRPQKFKKLFYQIGLVSACLPFRWIFLSVIFWILF